MPQRQTCLTIAIPACLVIALMLSGCATKPGAVHAPGSTGTPAGQVRLSWERPTTKADGTPLTDVAGYKLYYGRTSRTYEFTQTVGPQTTYVVSGLEPGRTYYFAVTAYDASRRESRFSDEVRVSVPPTASPSPSPSPAPGTVTGLDFPGSAAVSTTMRFKFENPQTNGLPIYGPGRNGVTYIWRAYPRHQPGYYTAFFWGNDDGKGNINTFLWKNGAADTYYGAHPYPRRTDATRHDWEISIQQIDVTNASVVYDRWYTQALRVWSDANGKHHEFYWDLSNTDASHRVTYTAPGSYGNTNPPSPALTWGDAPWNPGNEVWNGVLRGIQIYNSLLSPSDMLSEASAPLSTAAGANNIWYLNMNPTPSDISDKSGRGHHPVWVGSARPGLYTASGGDTTPPATTITSPSSGL